MPIETIVIVGGGIAGWLAALALARKTACAVTILETGGIDNSLGVPLAVETTLPSITQLHDFLGLDEAQIVRQTRSSYALGRALSNWTGTDGAGFHPYGEVGASIGPIGFQHVVARLRAEGQSASFANFSLAALCAQSGRFAPPPADTRTVLSTIAYGLHLNVAEYRDYLKREATALGVTTLVGEPTELKFDAAGALTAVGIGNGQSVEGDLFLDCSGQTRLLAAKLPHFRFESWAHWLPCRHIRTNALSASAPPPLYSHVDAHATGWQRFASTQTVLEEIVVSKTEMPGSEVYMSGRIAVPWTGNIIAMGGSAAIIDPLASTQLHLLGTAIQRLLRLFPNDRHATIESNEYNRQTIEELENARDFAILHYKCNGRAGDAFWNDVRGSDIPDRLSHKIALYESCGRVALHDEESFEAWDWIAIYDALGVQPRSYDALANGLPPDRIGSHLAQVRNVMLKAVASLPMQQDYLNSIRAAA